MVRIAPSILSADFVRLAEAVEGVARNADLLHVDVMDGHFVPNLTIGPPVVASLDASTDLYLDCHLMMTNPVDLVEAFAGAGADGITVHVEIGDTAATLEAVRATGVDVGLALNPATPVSEVLPYLDRVDLVLCMTVVPGFGGQSFMPEVLPKIEAVRAELDRLGSTAAIEVDGGIGPATIARAASAGADTFVAGSAVFGAPDPAAAIAGLREAASATPVG